MLPLRTARDYSEQNAFASVFVKCNRVRSRKRDEANPMGSNDIMSHPRSVWLVRHGQTDWNRSRRYMSFSDRALTPFGQRQAQSLARFFLPKKIDVILHTGLSRAEETALAIKGSRSIAIQKDERWREASHGLWEGLTYREVMHQHRENAMQRFGDPINIAPLEGESLAQLAVRVGDAWRSLGENFPNKRVVVVTHGGAIQMLLCQLFDAPLGEHWRWRIDLGSATGIDCYTSATILRAVNTIPKFF